MKRRADRRTRLRARLLDQNGDRCWLCHYPFAQIDTPTLDHLIPDSYGGRVVFENIRLAHARCNHRRGTDLSPLRRVAVVHPCTKPGCEGTFTRWGGSTSPGLSGYPSWCARCQREARPDKSPWKEMPPRTELDADPIEPTEDDLAELDAEGW